MGILGDGRNDWDGKVGDKKKGRKSGSFKQENSVTQLMVCWKIPRAAIKELVMLLEEMVLNCARAGICGKCQIILPCTFLVQPRLPRSIPGSGNAVQKLQRNQ